MIKYSILSSIGMYEFVQAQLQTQKVTLCLLSKSTHAMNMAQKRVRDASVKVTTPGGGHGSPVPIWSIKMHI